MEAQRPPWDNDPSIVNLSLVNNPEEWANLPNHVYVGRKHGDIEASIWANPFPVGHEYDLHTSLRLYEEHVKNSPELSNALGSLRNKVLGCWCRNTNQCHSNILRNLIGM